MSWITFPELLIWFPLLSAIVCFIFKDGTKAKNWALLSSIITFCIAIASLFFIDEKYKVYNYASYTLQYLGNTSFIVGLDGLSYVLTLLTAFLYPIIIISSYNKNYQSTKNYYGLLLLAQCGLMGVFCTKDALFFYFFWELALIPVYFLSSLWGGEKRIQATFKFFIYTFVGSLLMLIGIIYVYLHTQGDKTAHSFSMSAFYNASVQLSGTDQTWLFWLFFIAFAIKMPIFPFHTWQPDAYEQAPTSTTMVLSGIMVKMGLFACIRWLLPIFPLAVVKFDNVVIGLSVVGMIYASLIAMKQDDLKRLAAYSSIAHIGLMCVGIFVKNESGLQGMMIQMFSHGVNIVGLWIVIDLLERQTGIRKISQLSGIAHNAPVLTILLIVIALANIALPLTNAFVGEFMIFNGLFAFNKWYAAFAGISIILAAVYTLNMIQKVFYGEVNDAVTQVKEITYYEKATLIILIVAIFLMGLFPQPFINLTKEIVANTLICFK